MTQKETWIMHAGFGFAITLIFGFLAQSFAAGIPPVVWVGLMVGAYFLGRERRDYEIAHNVPAKDWMKGWNFMGWSTDNRNDLLTSWGGAAVGAVAVLIILNQVGA